jgi:hypothetical protein
MNEILTYASTNRRRVSVGYKLPDGTVERLYSKIEGSDQEAVRQAIDDAKRRGVREILVDVYRPNGTSEKICKSFTVPNDNSFDNSSQQTLNNISIGLDTPAPALTKTTYRPQPQNSRPVNHQSEKRDSWKDYALKNEQEKVGKLESENRRLIAENKTLDNKVRDFEKEMIKKDHEVEKLAQAIENKSGLNGFVDKAAESPHVMTLLAGMASRMMGIPMEQLPGQQTVNGSPELTSAQTEQYLANIRTWLYKQPEDVQEAFYQLIYHLTNSNDVKGAALRLTSVLKGNPMTGTHN